MKIEMTFKNKVKNGLKWAFMDQILSQVLLLFFGVFLARILPPSAFGLVAMVTMFTNFAALFIDLGFGVALVQKIDADEEHFSSVFWLNLIIGLFLYVFFFFTAPFISYFFNQPDINILIRVISLSFIISSLTSVQSNLLIRELKFKQKVIFNWIAIILGYTLAFYLAYNGFGVWSIVWMTLVTSATNSILYWFASNWHPSFVFNKVKIKELSSFGLNVLGDTSVNYWSRNFDNFIIARLLGSTELGLYSRAYSLMLLPLRNISSVITKVMFPAFSKKQNDVATIKRYYLRIIKYIALLTFPAMIGLSLVSKEFILLLFGTNWAGMIPVLTLLSLVGAVQSIFSLNGMIYNSLGKANIAFKVSLLVNFVLIIAFSIGVNYGILGIAWSYLIASMLLFFPIYNTAIKQLNTKLSEVFYTLKGVLFASLGMALAIVLVSYSIDTTLLVAISIKIVFGGLFYTIIIYYFEKELVITIKNKFMGFTKRNTILLSTNVL
ncbi:MOP flippase family protein [Flavobacterium franklandianum]|uniref:MOP flippase family protein n=1 Tax=Flavobacterium franklandianum TaxID=2594430 RepID=A0A553CK70_9FLAO|nr:MOP flippase family protein [Flavobacterium franklandianum]TRX20896.1 MOP flippase family protein [Flavobacterium franklandianum]TRX23162.1 MOP flippase family protein [Flavobacterium franklandianum]